MTPALHGGRARATVFGPIVAAGLDELAPAVASLHLGGASTVAHGIADVRRGSSLLARLLCSLLHLPRAPPQHPHPLSHAGLSQGKVE